MDTSKAATDGDDSEIEKLIVTIDGDDAVQLEIEVEHSGLANWKGTCHRSKPTDGSLEEGQAVVLTEVAARARTARATLRWDSDKNQLVLSGLSAFSPEALR